MPEKHSTIQSEPNQAKFRSIFRWEKLAANDEGPFHCSWEWHFSRATSRLAPILYSWGRHLSVKSESFYPSLDNIAEHFGRDRKTVIRALQEMIGSGWAEALHKEPGKPVTYRFVAHEEWARTNPGCCMVKCAMPWDGQGDSLARELYAISGGLAKCYPGQTNGLRKSGLLDEQIVSEFRIFLDRNPQQGQMWKSVFYRFHRHLLRLADDLRKAAGPKSTNEESHRRDTR